MKYTAWKYTALLLLLAAPARAELFLDTEKKDYRSPQHFALEFKFGQYSPNIDSTPGLTGKPFSDLFVAQDATNVGGRPSGALLSTLELDFQIWHGFGSLGIAGSVGLMRRSTHSFQYVMQGNQNVACTVPDCVRSSDSTTLSVLPLTLEVVYRFDVLTRWRIPIVPYLKGGVGYYIWWIENGSGGIAYVQQPTYKEYGAGGTWGLVAHPGVALQLDVLDPSAARVMDSEIGINHTYLFFEGNFAWITGFGNSSKLVLSDVNWNAGLAFEF